MIKRISSLAVGVVAVVAAVGLLVGTAGAATPIDQSQTIANDLQPIPGAPSVPTYRIAQTFTAGVTGTLDQVDLLLTRQMHPGDLSVEIRSAANGVPSASILASTVVPESSHPGGGTAVWVSVPLNVPSTAGTQYAIVVYAPFGECGADCWNWWGAVNDPYAGGAALWAVDGSNWVPNAASAFDFAFQTHVSRSFPDSVAQCKHDGWRRFLDFKNQGDCVSYVVTRGKNQPAG